MMKRKTLVSWRNSAVVAAALLALASLPLGGGTALAIGGEPAFKVGLDRLVLSGATYTHEDIATTGKETNSDGMSGADLFLEWVASDHFGLEISSTVAPLARSYQLGSGTPISDNVNESASFTTLGANLYFTRAKRKGFQYLVGVATGTMSVKHEFTGGTLGKVSSSNTFPVTTVKLGFEWVTELAGVRLQYLLLSGSTSNTTEIAGVKQTTDYSGGMGTLGVYAFF